jgi:hypothetical protein
MAPHEERRPGMKTEAAHTSLAGDSVIVTPEGCRCARCSRILTKPESIDRGLGWRCAKAVA